MNGVGKVCATIIPTRAQQIDRMLKEIARQGPDHVELRLDRLPVNEIKTALQKIDAFGDKTVLTIRSKEEGGYYEGSDNERMKILNLLLKQNKEFVDFEYRFVKRNKKFMEQIDRSNENILISYHNFYITPSLRVIVNLYKEMAQFGDLVKIVTTAQDVMDNIKIVELYSKATEKAPLLAFAMGEYGKISRILSITHFGAPFAYCYLDRPIVPGMLSVLEMKKIVRAMP